jgi:hypothetical protein
MSKGFLENWIEIPTNGTALASSTTQTSLLAGITGAQPTLPAGYFERLGKPLWLRVYGRIGTVVTTPGTLNLYLRFGSVDVFDSGAMTLNTTAQTTELFVLDVMLFARTLGTGTSANVAPMGTFASHAVIGAAAAASGGATIHTLPYTTAPGTAGNGFDSTAAQLIDIQAKWSVSNASNTIRLEGGMLGLFN